MTEFEHFAKALALTESEDVEVAWGDPKDSSGVFLFGTDGKSAHKSGRNLLACGRWQMHPAFVWDFRPEPIHLYSSWDEVFHQVLSNFYQRRRSAHPSIYHLAMEFHLGITAVAHGASDEAYVKRFIKNWDATSEEFKA